MLSSVAATGRVQRLEPLGGSLVFGALKAQKEAYDDKKASGPRDARLPAVEGQTAGILPRRAEDLPRGFRQGLGSERVKLEWKVKKMSKRDDGSFARVPTTPPSGRKDDRTITATVVMTAPALRRRRTVQPRWRPKARHALRKFYYPPVASVTVSYPETAFRLDGTSALPDGGPHGVWPAHPRSQGIRTLGTIYSVLPLQGRSRQPGRRVHAPQLHRRRAGRRGMKDMSDEELVKAVHEDALKTILKPGTPLPSVVGVKVWEKAIPQFNLGHLDVLAEAKAGLATRGATGCSWAGTTPRASRSGGAWSLAWSRRRSSRRSSKRREAAPRCRRAPCPRGAGGEPMRRSTTRRTKYGVSSGRAFRARDIIRRRLARSRRRHSLVPPPKLSHARHGPHGPAPLRLEELLDVVGLEQRHPDEHAPCSKWSTP